MSLTIEDVHGYLPVNVEFDADLTFLTGLNGCGKTSALRILMGLLTPNIEDLARIEFTKAVVTIEVEGEQTRISAVRTDSGLELRVDGFDTPLSLTSAELELLTAGRLREDGPSGPVHRKVQNADVFKAIQEKSTPMFLGIDRRLVTGDNPSIDAASRFQDAIRIELMRQRRYDDDDVLSLTSESGLLSVKKLIRDTMNGIRAQQERLDTTLREKILLSAFQFNMTDFTPHSLPDKKTIENFRGKQAELLRAATLLRLPESDVATAMKAFFARMDQLVTNVRSTEKKASAEATFSWFANKNQADRVLDNLGEFQRYASKSNELREPVDRFLRLVNQFFTETGKQLSVSDTDQLEVRVLRGGPPKDVTALSSGERQLLIMLGHLALNKRLRSSGVFIVDEPELSLHISWQEMFVQAVHDANPDVQLIFATHSPAIVLDKGKHCRSLSGVSS